jgi:hypothetical protein
MKAKTLKEKIKENAELSRMVINKYCNLPEKKDVNKENDKPYEKPN